MLYFLYRVRSSRNQENQLTKNYHEHLGLREKQTTTYNEFRERFHYLKEQILDFGEYPKGDVFL